MAKRSRKVSTKRSKRPRRSKSSSRKTMKRTKRQSSRKRTSRKPKKVKGKSVRKRKRTKKLMGGFFSFYLDVQSIDAKKKLKDSDPGTFLVQKLSNNLYNFIIKIKHGDILEEQVFEEESITWYQLKQIINNSDAINDYKNPTYEGTNIADIFTKLKGKYEVIKFYPYQDNADKIVYDNIIPYFDEGDRKVKLGINYKTDEENSNPEKGVLISGFSLKFYRNNTNSKLLKLINTGELRITQIASESLVDKKVIDAKKIIDKEIKDKLNENVGITLNYSIKLPLEKQKYFHPVSGIIHKTNYTVEEDAAAEAGTCSEPNCTRTGVSYNADKGRYICDYCR